MEQITDCLWTQGYAMTPISLLVEQTGVKAASLYALFGSKKGIMLAALEAYAEKTFEELTLLLRAHPPGREQIHLFLQHLLEASLDDPQARGCFLVNSILEASPENPDFAAVLDFSMARIRDILEEDLGRAPDLRPGLSPREAALFLQVQVWGLKLMARLGPSREQGEILIRQTLETLFTEPV